VAQAVGGHHGAWPAPRQVVELRLSRTGDKEWNDVRADLVRALAEVLAPPSADRLGCNLVEKNAVLTLCSGLTSVADWIGSMEAYFPYVEGPTDLRVYADRAERQARRALSRLKWTVWQPPEEEMAFEALFPFPPNPMQQTVVELASRLRDPALVIIEAPTGSGKTEAALYLADHWACALQQRGLYVAMPTMATSNQMHGRVQRVLRQRYPEGTVAPLLVHSQARWTKDMPPEVRVADEQLEDPASVMTWFLPRKRSLLAAFGVGTVDQTFLSVLQTRHFFVRLFGLSHKTVVFDEVHAYDTYMSELFQRLLVWLRAVGTSVVLLSATLSTKTRQALLQAYAGQDVDFPDVPYPAITWAAGEDVGVIPLPAPTARNLSLQWMGREPEAVVRFLSEALAEGGCAAVLCNTVARTQEIYRTLRQAGLVDDENLILFHGRFPPAWRDEIEHTVLACFGKPRDDGGRRPHKAIVVATQVIEQSLDLDFDIMISDLAPVDLLIQRAGRLHRHRRDGRPAPLSQPRLVVAVNEGEDGVPDFGPDVYVYERYVLLRSYLALRGRDRLTLPEDTTELIEAVYGDGRDLPGGVTVAQAKELHQALERMRAHEQKDVFEAIKRLVYPPGDERLLTQSYGALEEESPELHEAFQALTRLGRPSLPLVCLHSVGDGLNTEPDGSGRTVDLSQEPDTTLTYHLARCTLSVTHYPVVQHFLAQDVPAGWGDHPLLRDHRVALFDQGVCLLPGTPHRLRLSREFGLEIEREVE